MKTPIDYIVVQREMAAGNWTKAIMRQTMVSFHRGDKISLFYTRPIGDSHKNPISTASVIRAKNAAIALAERSDGYLDDLDKEP